MDEITVQRLIAAAKTASGNAYAPYSGYAVGAAVLASDGRMYTGCNVENASYGLTMCAERTAIFAAYANGVRQIDAVAVYAPRAPAPFPCGACRQVMSEGGSSPEVIIAGWDGSIIRLPFRELFPYVFRLDD